MNNQSVTNTTQNKSKESLAETLDAIVIGALIKGRNVIIPDFGYLELKSFADRCTVLFKESGSQDLISKPFPTESDKKDKDYLSLLLEGISKPLKEGKVVSIPNLGIFRPLRKEDGSFHVSFTPSSFLRKRLNDEPVNEEFVAEQKLSPVLDAKKEKLPITEEAPELRTTEKEKKNINNIKEDIFSIESKPKTTEKEQPANKNIVEAQPRETFPVEKNETKSTTASNEAVEVKKKNIGGLIILLFTVLIAIIIVIVVISLQKKDEGAPTNVPSHPESVNLLDLAKEHYGNSAFWVYIYECNEDKITSPVNIPKGIKITIPDLSSPAYNIDVNDSEEIIRAKLREESILQKLK